MKADLQKQKMEWEAYLTESKKTEEAIRKELSKPAEEGVKVQLGLEKLFDETNIKVDDDAVQEEIDEMLSFYPPEFAPMMAQRFEKGGQQWEMTRRQLMLRKLVAMHTA